MRPLFSFMIRLVSNLIKKLIGALLQGVWPAMRKSRHAHAGLFKFEPPHNAAVRNSHLGCRSSPFCFQWTRIPFCYVFVNVHLVDEMPDYNLPQRPTLELRNESRVLFHWTSRTGCFCFSIFWKDTTANNRIFYSCMTDIEQTFLFMYQKYFTITMRFSTYHQFVTTDKCNLLIQGFFCF